MYDAFLSYSRKDKAFARHLEKALQNYRPPHDLKVPQRGYLVFRDEEDFTGTEYFEAVGQHLKNSSKLIVLCSPNARQSTYVDDEIRRFLNTNTASNIVPILTEGIPNNEVKPGQEEQMAFPAALCEHAKMPLAVNYLNFDPLKGRIDRAPFLDAWYTLLANLYGVSRSEIEERDRKKRARARRITTAVTVSILGAISATLIWALLSRERAISEEQLAQARKFLTQAEQLRADGSETLRLSVLLAVESLRRSPSKEAESSLKKDLLILPQSLSTSMQDGPIDVVRIMEKGERLVYAGSNGNAGVLQTNDLANVRTFDLGARTRRIDISPTANALAAITATRADLWNIESGKSTIALDGQFTASAFSADGSHWAGAAKDRSVIVNLNDLRSGLLSGLLPQELRAIAVSAKGRFAATGGSSLTMWDVDARKQVFNRTGQGNVLAVAFDLEGEKLAVGYEYHMAQVFSVDQVEGLPAGGHLLTTIEPEGAIDGLAWSGDGLYLATIDSTNGAVRIWYGMVNNQKGIFINHGQRVKTLAFTESNGRAYLVTAGGNVVRLWDAEDGTEVERLIEGNPITSVSISSDNRRIATSTENGTLRVWEGIADLKLEQLNQEHTPEGWIDLACHRVVRGLTTEEWQKYIGNEPYTPACS